ncbi:MAG: endonuclease III [Deltaproteobacteria bacterium]|nr:endonuclease III [Deltaproteobacteria bacterium]
MPELLERIRPLAQKWVLPVVEALRGRADNPFAILITSLISLRTKEEQTAPAASQLLALANTPQEMLALGEDIIAKILHPVGFYRNKTKTILEVSRRLLSEYDSRVPDTLEELLTFKGVGRKTANLVMSVAYNKPAICVDIHVHRITNRVGYVKTTSPEETEFALRKKLPPQHWQEINPLLVAFGREMCHPTSPYCSICPITHKCPRHGVKRTR